MYEMTNTHQIVKTDRNGDKFAIANFTAEITDEVRYVDDRRSETHLTLVGRTDKHELPKITLSAKEFQGMNWITPNWGVKAIVTPLPNATADVRTAIMLNSDPTQHTVYMATGWHGNQFMAANGAIGPSGHDPQISVHLPPELRRATLQLGKNPAASINQTFNLLELAPKHLTWPLLAATFRPPLGDVDYAIHLAGRTGTFKSEIASLCQSCYGWEFDARHLPASWSSTPNALEALAYRAKNLIVVLDDFVPFGTSWQVRAYQKTADQIIRGQGNQAGRARLTDTSNLQTTMYPRGLIFSTGEDTPEGHSIRARMMILDIAPGDVDKEMLSHLQGSRKHLNSTMAHYIQWIAKQGPPQLSESVQITRDSFRDKHLDVGHSRTPAMIGDMMASVQALLSFAMTHKAIDGKKYDALYQEAYDAILQAGESQAAQLEATDPVDAFTEAIRTVLASCLGHFRTKRGGIPEEPESLGWTKEEGLGDIATYRAHGQKLGWIDWTTGELLVDINPAYQLIKRHAGGKLVITKQTLFKRLKDAGLLHRTDEARSRNTCRVTCEGHPRNVLVMSAPTVLQLEETP